MADSNTNSHPILALATSEKVVSTCVASSDEILGSVDSSQWMAQFNDEESKTVGKSTAIISMIQAMLREKALETGQLEAIALTNGPGGFTGLRVGIVAAKMLCYAWNLPVIVTNSLEVAADKIRRQRNLAAGDSIWAVTDAQRRQVFASKMIVGDDGELKIVQPQALLERQAFVDLLEGGDHVTGSGAYAFRESIEQQIGGELPSAADAACDAEAVAMLARRRFDARDFDDYLSIEPIYFRPSAAEEVRLAAGSTQ